MTRHEINAALIREAAPQAVVLWDEPRGGIEGSGGWWRYGTLNLASSEPEDNS